MRVLILASTFPPDKDGVAEAAAAMAQGFLEAGWKVKVFTGPHPERKSPSWRGAEVREFLITGMGSAGFPFQGETENLENAVESAGADCLICHSWPAWSTDVPARVFRKIRARKIIVGHGFGAQRVSWHRRFPFGLVQWLRWQPYLWRLPQLIRSFDALVFLSRRRDFRAFFDHKIATLVAPERCHVIPNGVAETEPAGDPGKFRQSHGISPSACLFVCIANYSNRKDQGFAVRAFREANIPGSVLAFIGSELNEDSARFQREDIDRTGAGTILWLEKLDRETTLAAIAAADCAVLSSWHEAQPIFLLEAMRAGKPWIARDAGCISEMPGGICIRSAGEMAEEMKNASKEKTRFQRLGAIGASSVAERYNRTSYIKSYIALVRSLCDPSSSGQ